MPGPSGLCVQALGDRRLASLATKPVLSLTSVQVQDKHAEYEADRNHSQQTSAGDASINSVKVHLAWNAYIVVFIAQVGKLVE